MAKPKKPRIGDKPKHVTKYMAEIIDRSDTKEVINYKYFDDYGAARAWYAGPQLMGSLVRLFRVETRLIRETQH